MRVPGATYRLQFNAKFRFADATRIVPYLHALGITDLYASPLFKAGKKSSHGYDVVDPTQLDPKLGTQTDFQRLVEGLHAHDMGLLLDVVPNHMGVANDGNPYWNDVLENGPSSTYARFFDIDWKPPKSELVDKVLLPILGDQYGRVLEDGQIRLSYQRGAFWIRIYDRRLPVAPRTYAMILELLLDRVRTGMPQDDPDLVELRSILTAIGHLPPRTETDAARIDERRREKQVVKRRIATLMNANRMIRSACDEVVALINGRRGDPRSFDRLEELLAAQAYRLSFWRVAADEINYRRFFDINDLGAIRVEDLEVFRVVHSLVFRLVRNNAVTGLRIDHPDGLYDPEQYFRDIQEGCRQARRLRGAVDDTFVVVEKILAAEETLDPNWSVHGTTGYEFLNALNGIFVKRENALPFRDLYHRFTGNTRRHEDIVYEAKRLVLESSMAGELRVLSRRLDRISEQQRASRDFTLASLRVALRELIACFPVYRTYTRMDSPFVSDEARQHIDAACAAAKRRNPVMNKSLFDFIAAVLRLEEPGELSESQRAEHRQFVMRFQQITAPVMAKGVEDTTFYRYFPLASLNEVGGEPERFGTMVEEWHGRNAGRLRAGLHSLSASSTHDNKRGEDVRARINVLSQIPGEWEEALTRWHAMNQRFKTAVDGVEVPDRNDEYLLYQTLVGTWPLLEAVKEGEPGYVERIQDYMLKAVKEAKVYTSWVNPNDAYEGGIERFVREILRPAADNGFIADLAQFMRPVQQAAAVESLAACLLKVTSPGVPDLYQGSETWRFDLVDPDNRRPVDFAQHAATLQRLREGAADPLAVATRLLEEWRSGAVKMYVASKALQLRREREELLRAGEYVPLEAKGEHASHVCAFARGAGSDQILVVVPRLVLGLDPKGAFPLGNVWGDTVLQLHRSAADAWRLVFTSEVVRTQRDSWTTELPLSEVFGRFPVALLATLGPER